MRAERHTMTQGIEWPTSTGGTPDIPAVRWTDAEDHKWIILVGNMAEGFKAYGIFGSRVQAERWLPDDGLAMRLEVV